LARGGRRGVVKNPAGEHPTLPDDQVKDTPSILFGPGSYIQAQYDDPEVQGGKIALIAAKQQLAQKPPSFLDHMQSSFLKQLAYHQKVLNAEKEIAGINCDIADFLSGMSNDPSEQLVICVNGSEEMKRNEEAMGGQLWIQGDRQMTASNHVMDGVANNKEGAILSATMEAVTWKSALDLEDGPRKGQRVVIYPKEMTQLEQVLSTGDTSIDDVDGQPITYTVILQAAHMYKHPPIFLTENSEQITSVEETATKVPMWMNIAAQVATGSRRMVYEDGPDKMNSDDDDALEDVKPDEEKGMYTPEMDPNQGPLKLTQHEAARQRAAAQTLKAHEAQKVPPRSQSPVGGSSDDDDPTGSEWIWSQTKGCMRRNKFFRDRAPTVEPKKETPPTEAKMEKPPAFNPFIPRSSTPVEKAPVSSKAESKPVPRASTPVESVPAQQVGSMNVPADTLPNLKKGKKSSVPAPKKGAGKKAADRPAEPEATHPMTTRAASRAGSLRPRRDTSHLGGSGQKDTRVASSHPSKT
jgi:hypothetical protein